MFVPGVLMLGIFVLRVLESELLILGVLMSEMLQLVPFVLILKVFVPKMFLS